MSEWQILKSYCLERLKGLLFGLLYIMVFLIIFFLYRLPVYYVLYPAGICLTFWLLIVAVRYYFYRREHLNRELLLNNIEVIEENLEKPRSLIEMDYQNLLIKSITENTQKRQEVEKGFQEVKEYLTLWSHQMKTPITSLELLLQEGEGNGQAREQVNELERYVDMLMQYIRLDSMSGDLLIETCDLYKLVKECVKYYMKTFISKGISLQLEPFEQTAVTDEKWLLFVLKQILSNALKYTDNGSIAISISKKSNPVLIIEDTGIGILEEDIPRLFEKNFTGYNGRQYKKATGIGLYLSKKILDKLGHKIKITSKVQEGTRVEISFPGNLTIM